MQVNLESKDIMYICIYVCMCAGVCVCVCVNREDRGRVVKRSQPYGDGHQVCMTTLPYELNIYVYTYIHTYIHIHTHIYNV